jgi:starch phosphorylase
MTESATSAIKHDFLENLFYTQGKFPALATQMDYYHALAHTVRDHLLQRWISTAAAYTRKGSRTVSYLSAEFLMGPHLGNNLINLGMYEEVRTSMAELGLDFDQLVRLEQARLGNGGLTPAACFIDSLVTLESRRWARIRYEFGIFHQDRRWLAAGAHRQPAAPQSLGDRAEVGGRGQAARLHREYRDEHDRMRVRWVPHKKSSAFPMTRSRYRNNTANTCGCGSPRFESFDFSVFNRGDYAAR